MEGYCLKCKKKMLMKSKKKLKVNGRNYYQGTCSKCGTKISVITK